MAAAAATAHRQVMAMPRIVLRWRGRCCHCHAVLHVGADARFDTATHELWCASCWGSGWRDDHDEIRACIAEARRALRRAS